MSGIDGFRPGDERGAFCYCPPGTFMMGPYVGPPASGDAVSVTISQGFWLGKYLVTQALYEHVTGFNPSAFRGISLPVETVTKPDADAFCLAVSKIERQAGRLPDGWEYRLPTEAQWEYACRAGTTTAFSWGDDPNVVGQYAWWALNSDAKTHAVGQKKQNPWGLYDMHGNVIEWCRDAWSDTLAGGTDPEVRPSDVPQPSGWSSTPMWVCRGGSWQYPQAERLASRNRERLGPVDKSYVIGFRLSLVKIGPLGGQQ